MTVQTFGDYAKWYPHIHSSVAGDFFRENSPPTWRECIKKVWEVDPLKWPHCSGEMKIVSFLNEHPVIRKILVHLDLWVEGQKQRPPPVREGPEHSDRSQQRPPDERLRSHDLFGDGWMSWGTYPSISVVLIFCSR